MKNRQGMIKKLRNLFLHRNYHLLPNFKPLFILNLQSSYPSSSPDLDFPLEDQPLWTTFYHRTFFKSVHTVRNTKEKIEQHPTNH